MLVKVLVTKWEGSQSEDQRITDTTNGTYFLLQGRNINGIQVRATTKSKLMFTENIHNPREKASYMETESTAAAIVTAADATFNSSFITLNLYTDNDLTKATVATRINCESISWVYKDVQYPATKSWVIYYEGGKRRKVVCDYSINQILSLADDGNLTTT